MSYTVFKLLTNYNGLANKPSAIFIILSLKILGQIIQWVFLSKNKTVMEKGHALFHHTFHTVYLFVHQSLTSLKFSISSYLIAVKSNTPSNIKSGKRNYELLLKYFFEANLSMKKACNTLLLKSSGTQ